jgi:hypothetical protein
MSPSTCRDAATALAALGVPVFPLVFRGKEPLPRSRGHHDASADLVITRRRWAGRLLNVGVRTGGTLSVLDVDGEAGYRSLADLEHQHGPLPVTFTVSTSRGEHRYLSGPALPCRTGFLPGLDWKANGGYVVGPCSVHPSGKVYACHDWNTPIATAPTWLAELVRHRPTPAKAPAERIVHTDRYISGAIAGEARRLRHVTHDRNISLFCAIVRLRKLLGTLPPDCRASYAALIEVEMLAAADHTGIAHNEALKTIRSGLTGVRHGS